MEVDPLFYYIINNNSLIISTDGTTQARKNGGGWIVLEDGTKIVSGHNPNFGQSEDITSYRT